VVYDSIEKLEKGQVTELPGQAAAYSYFTKELYQALGATFGLWFAQGAFEADENTALNKLLPDVKTLKVKELLEKAWKN
jgi:hypothetical protein